MAHFVYPKWTWLPPAFKDIEVSQDKMELFVPSSSSHGAFACHGSYAITAPGSYTFVVDRVLGNSMFAIGHNLPDTDYIWSGSEGSLSIRSDYISPSGPELYVYDVHVSDDKVVLVEQRTARPPQGMPLKVRRTGVPIEKDLTLEAPTYPWLFSVGVDHNSRVRIVLSESDEWSPATHASSTPKGFRALVYLLFLLRNDDSCMMSAMPRELMYEIITLLWSQWDQGSETQARRHRATKQCIVE